MKQAKIEAMRGRVLSAPDKVYTNDVYQYWINGNGQLCRAFVDDLDTTEMLKEGAIEILD